jgi:outer membrane usher protein
LEGAASGSRDGFGAAASFGLTADTLMDRLGLAGNFRFSADMRSTHFTPIFADAQSLGSSITANAFYSLPLPHDFTLSASGSISYGTAADAGRAGAELSFTKTVRPDMTWSLSASYDTGSGANAAAEIGGFLVAGRLNIAFGEHSNLALSQEGKEGQGRSLASFSSDGMAGGGRYTSRFSLENDGRALTGSDPQRIADASASYSGTHFEMSADHSRRVIRLGNNTVSEITSVSGAGAIAMADGFVAVGRPVSDSFAIVNRHQSLADASVRVSPSETSARGASHVFGDALVPDLPAYSHTQLTVELENAPAGYDLGSGSFDLKPAYRSGYVLKVGSDYNLMVSGTAQDAKGEPISLVSGLAKELSSGREIPIFTNEAGRFSLPGVRKGDWKLEFLASPPACFQLTIPETASGFVDTGALKEGCAL